MRKEATIKSMNYIMLTFNTLFAKDVDTAYQFLRQELRTVRQDVPQVPVKLADGKVIFVEVGTNSPPKLYRA